MPQPDLLTRARSAVTQDEECAAIRAAVCHFIPDAAQRLPLTDIIVAVRSGRAPRPVLLGVAAALVPDGPVGLGLHGYAGLSRWSAEIVSRRLLPETFEDDVAEGRGPTPAPRTPDRHTGGRE